MLCAKIRDFFTGFEIFRMIQVIRCGQKRDELFPAGGRKLNRHIHRFRLAAFEFHLAHCLRIELDALHLVRSACVFVTIRKTGKISER